MTPASFCVLTIIEDVSGDGQGNVPILFFTTANNTDPQQGTRLWGAISFEAGPLCSSLEAHLQHIGTLTAFLELFCYRSFCSTLAFFTARLWQTAYHTCCCEQSYSLTNSSLASYITRSLSNRACLRYDGKTIAFTREC
ncbi:hypothetical protein TNCV_527601 [Trichonephila clavipes]|nr:hypothetical protein TNCV_527601 [Trichonephila clavipes]